MNHLFSLYNGGKEIKSTEKTEKIISDIFSVTPLGARRAIQECSRDWETSLLESISEEISRSSEQKIPANLIRDQLGKIKNLKEIELSLEKDLKCYPEVEESLPKCEIRRRVLACLPKSFSSRIACGKFTKKTLEYFLLNPPRKQLEDPKNLGQYIAEKAIKDLCSDGKETIKNLVSLIGKSITPIIMRDTELYAFYEQCSFLIAPETQDNMMSIEGLDILCRTLLPQKTLDKILEKTSIKTPESACSSVISSCWDSAIHKNEEVEKELVTRRFQDSPYPLIHLLEKRKLTEKSLPPL